MSAGRNPWRLIDPTERRHKTGEERRPALRREVHGRPSHLSLDSLGAAARLAAPEVIAELRTWLSRSTESSELVEGAQLVELLGRIAPGTPCAAEAVTVLTEALDSPVKGNAAEALGHFGAAAAPALAR